MLLFYCSQINVQLIIISVFDSNNSPREKNCCDTLLSFLETFFKRNQGQDLYITLKTIKWVLIFLLHFFLSTPLPTAYREIHGNR